MSELGKAELQTHVKALFRALADGREIRVRTHKSGVVHVRMFYPGDEMLAVVGAEPTNMEAAAFWFGYKAEDRYGTAPWLGVGPDVVMSLLLEYATLMTDVDLVALTPLNFRRRGV